MGIPHSDGGHQDGDRRNGVGAGWRGDSGVEEARWINSGGGVTVWGDAAQWEGGAEPGTIILGREKNITLTIFCHFSHALLTCVELKYCRTWMKKSENCESLQCSVHFWEEPQLLQYFSH